VTRVLLLNTRVPWPVDDGNSLRVLELARHRAPDIVCHLVCHPQRVEQADALRGEAIFDSVTVLPARDEQRDWRRLFRRSGRDYARRAFPRHFARSQRILQELVDGKGIDVLVATLLRSEEYVRPLVGPRKVVDQYDCATLALERELAVDTPRGWRERRRLHRRLARLREMESRLHETADLITAISPADVEALQRMNPRASVELVPNGVRDDLLAHAPDHGRERRGVAFWGNLDFTVNQHAIGFFVERVWRPHLAEAGVEFVIIGRNPTDAIRELAASHERIRLAGYVEDLFGYLDRYPILVNTMVSGSGLKNKVIEAFAARRAVVTTTLGIESVDARHDVHCLVADEPAAIAAAVLQLLDDPDRRQRLTDAAHRLVAERYTWGAVGRSWSESLRNLGGVQLA
jgi:glycosyltransferase involved in cell wall biosynthesis